MDLEVQELNKKDATYIQMAESWAQLSHANRRKVGALIVKNTQIISDGYNGMPSGFDNRCEEDVFIHTRLTEKTKWAVLHAEANAILKCARYGNSCEGSTLYLTTAPCKNCSKLIHQSGIKRVVYRDDYEPNGIDFLKEAGVIVNNFSKITSKSS